MMNIWQSNRSAGSDSSNDEDYKEFGPVLSEQEKVSPYWQGLRWGKSSSSSSSPSSSTTTTTTSAPPRRRLNSADSCSIESSSIGEEEEEEEYKEFGPILSIQEQAVQQQQRRRRPLRRMIAQTRNSMTGWEVTNWIENRRRTQEICHEKDIEYTIQTQRCNLMMLDVQ